MDKEIEENYSENPVASFEMVDYMLSNPPQPPQTQMSLDKLSFTDVMQFADFGPKLALNQSRMPLSEDEDYFHYDDEEEEGAPASLPLPPPQLAGEEEDGGRFSENNSSVQEQLGFGGGGKINGGAAAEVIKNRRKRPRAMKTTEEVESQRMTHIAVERNRRRQMNEHLRVLRSLMPGSYVQRGDQASIIGGAIEFVRELEQLLQCLESQKRRRIFGTNDQPPRNMTDAPPPLPLQQQQQQQQPFLPPLPLPGSSCDIDPNSSSSLREDMAENKSCLADIEVRLLGADAMIKILSRRRPGQLIKIIAALEDLQFGILHTNITTIEQTVLYSFNVKMGGETRCTAEDIASSVQQILSFIDTSTI